MHRPSVDAEAPSVCAVVLSDQTGETLDAVERQTRVPDDLVVAGDLREGLRAALPHETTWVWLVEGSVLPQRDALAQLLGAAEPFPGMPPPALLASRVVTAEGSLDPGSFPVHDVRDMNFLVAAVERDMVALRVARRGSLLVHRRALGTAIPRGGDMPWTARLLRHEHGLLVIGSVVVRRHAGERARLELGGRLALLCVDGLTLRDRMWFAARLAQDVIAVLRR